MPLLTLGDVAVDFGTLSLFRGVTVTVDSGECWGVVGRNGSGKTTLFNVIAGTREPSRGAVSRQANLRIAVLDQYRDFGDADTVWQAAARGYRDLLELEVSLERQAHRLAEAGSATAEADLERYGRDQERFAHLGGYEFRARVDAVLHGLGFDPEAAITWPVAALSGGERGRVGLAGQLAAPADLVLLDEPTNHLDLDTIDWLRRYLREFGETVLVISHDRAFLDEVADHILHLADRTATAYRGGYSAFVRQRDQMRLTAQRQAAQQQKMIAREEDYIRRNIAGGNSAQAKGRRRRLERLPRLSPPQADDDVMRLRLETADRGGDIVAAAENLTVEAGGQTLIERFTAVVRRGDVIALVGPNGAGKTTLLGTLLGERAPAKGTVRLGSGITPAWFRQDLGQLPVGKTLYDCIAELRPMWGRGAVQNHLGAFGFSGEEVLRATEQCSGGERARMALALITLTRANLLVLDEPTNHLDVESIEVLEDALEEYDGSAIVVSHDRAFLRELTTRVWAFDGRRIVDYGGSFVEWEAALAQRAAEAARAVRKASREGAVRSKTAAKKAAASRREDAAGRRAARRAVAELEMEAERLEGEIARREHALQDSRLYAEGAEGAREAQRLDTELRELRSSLEETLERWARAAEQ